MHAVKLKSSPATICTHATYLAVLIVLDSPALISLHEECSGNSDLLAWWLLVPSHSASEAISSHCCSHTTASMYQQPSHSPAFFTTNQGFPLTRTTHQRLTLSNLVISARPTWQQGRDICCIQYVYYMSFIDVVYKVLTWVTTWVKQWEKI
jgi:hypothetical protein